jgi:hypothetical protein
MELSARLRVRAVKPRVWEPVRAGFRREGRVEFRPAQARVAFAGTGLREVAGRVELARGAEFPVRALASAAKPGRERVVVRRAAGLAREPEMSAARRPSLKRMKPEGKPPVQSMKSQPKSVWETREMTRSESGAWVAASGEPLNATLAGNFAGSP